MDNVKNKLIESNKYDDIVEILNNIINDKISSYPVDPYIDDGDTKWRVDGDKVRTEAVKLLYTINNNTISEYSFDDFNELHQYVQTQTDMKLHNYAINISHNIEPLEDMNIIRSWLILDNLIINMADQCTFEWYIPDGWKNNNNYKRRKNMKEYVKVDSLIKEFEGMKNRESLLARGGISQEDLYTQILGTIVHVAMEDNEHTEGYNSLIELKNFVRDRISWINSIKEHSEVIDIGTVLALLIGINQGITIIEKDMEKKGESSDENN